MARVLASCAAPAALSLTVPSVEATCMAGPMTPNVELTGTRRHDALAAWRMMNNGAGRPGWYAVAGPVERQVRRHCWRCTTSLKLRASHVWDSFGWYPKRALRLVAKPCIGRPGSSGGGGGPAGRVRRRFRARQRTSAPQEAVERQRRIEGHNCHPRTPKDVSASACLLGSEARRGWRWSRALTERDAGGAGAGAVRGIRRAVFSGAERKGDLHGELHDA